MYEVYALKCGERDTTSCQFFYRDTAHDPVTLHFFVWAILGGEHPVLVDTGFTEDDAAERAIRGYASPTAMLARIGVGPQDVRTALITHLHWDHWDGHRLFPSAELWVQREEVAFWTGPAARHEAVRVPVNPAVLADVVRLNFEGRLRLVDGDREVLPGIRLHRVGGHTEGLQIVTVETSRGRVVLTSDASHFYRNVERYQPVQLFTNLPAMMAGFDTIWTLAGQDRLVVAGHDPEVAQRFHAVEGGVVRIA